MMCKSSKKYKLGSLADVQNGYAFKAIDFATLGIPIIKIKNIQPPNISFEDAQYFNGQIDNRLKQFLIVKKDILISMTGSHVSQISSAVGKVGRYGFDSPALLNQRVGKIYSQDETKLNNDYLYYLMARPEVQFELATNAGGSANQANISPQQIKNLEFEIPGIETQTRIASILSSLDDKISLNRRMNQTLEQMAQAFFNHYFVDNIGVDNLPEGWKESAFSEEFIVDKGLSYKGSGLSKKGEGKPMHNLNSIYEGGGYKYEGIKFYKAEHKDIHVVKPGDIIVANTEQGHKYLLIGYPSIVPTFMPEGIFSHHIYRVRPNENSYLSPQFLYYLIMNPKVRGQIIGHTNGTTVNMLYKEGLQKPIFIKPPKDLIEKFSSIVVPIWKKKELLYLENQSLNQIRDTLLPKLMSSEIDVSELNEEKLKEDYVTENIVNA